MGDPLGFGIGDPLGLGGMEDSFGTGGFWGDPWNGGSPGIWDPLGFGEWGNPLGFGDPLGLGDPGMGGSSGIEGILWDLGDPEGREGSFGLGGSRGRIPRAVGDPEGFREC